MKSCDEVAKYYATMYLVRYAANNIKFHNIAIVDIHISIRLHFQTSMTKWHISHSFYHAWLWLPSKKLFVLCAYLYPFPQHGKHYHIYYSWRVTGNHAPCQFSMREGKVNICDKHTLHVRCWHFGYLFFGVDELPLPPSFYILCNSDHMIIPSAVPILNTHQS